MSEPIKEIMVLPSPAPDVMGKGILSGGVTGPIKLNAEVLRENLANFVDTMNAVISGIPKLTEPFKLDEIEIVIEVNGEGSLQLVGGVKVGASGGITLKLKR